MQAIEPANPSSHSCPWQGIPYEAPLILIGFEKDQSAQVA